MNVLSTDIDGLRIIEPKVFGDSRGYFFESFSMRDFTEQVAIPAVGCPVEFVQDNESRSVYGVVRGLHFQKPPFSQTKLVRCVRGKVLDVVVDLRSWSQTYGKWFSVELSEENHRQLFIPKGFAHGFSVLSDEAVFQYKCDEFYHPEADDGILLTDPSLGIDWQIEPSKMILSAKDVNRAPLGDRSEAVFVEKMY